MRFVCDGIWSRLGVLCKSVYLVKEKICSRYPPLKKP